MAISGTIRNVRISGMACAVPETVVGNDCFVARFGAEQMQKFEKMVGVKERHVAPDGMTTSDLACRAAEELRDCWSGDTVDAIIFVSQTPDYCLPATACVLHKRLGVKKSCIAFDVNLGCSGFVYGIYIASSLINGGGVCKVALLGGDTSLKPVWKGDPSAAPLFGDSGFAVILDRDKSAPSIDYSFCTDGGGYRAIIQPGLSIAGRMPVVYSKGGESRDIGNLLSRESKGGIGPSELHMDGMDVFNFTINEVPDLIKEQMTRSGVTATDIDLLVLHHANKFVLKNVAMATGFGMGKVPISMDRYGNTSSTSIPLTLCDYGERNPGAGKKKVLMSGFGVGLSWGTLVTDFDFGVCRKIALGAEIFQEGKVKYESVFIEG